MRLLAAVLVGAMVVPLGAAAARPPQPVVHEDPDDTAGPLDVLSVSRRTVKFEGARHYEHRIHFQERWEDDEVHVYFMAYTHGFQIPSTCDYDDCTGDWEGTVYEDEEGNLRGEILEVSNCNDCQAWNLAVAEDANGDVLFYLPRGLFYRGTKHYDMELETHFENSFRVNARPDCRLPVCHDYVPAEGESMRFPVGA